MACFIACFGCTKKRKRLKSARTSLIPHDAPHGLGSYQPLESASVKLDVKEISACHVAGSDLKKEKATLGSVLRARKKVNFNLNVRTYDLINSQDYSQRDAEEEKNEKDKIGHREIKDKEESTTTSYSSNYRYKDFVDCEEEDDEAEYSGNDVDEEDDLYDDCLEDCDDEYELGGDRSLDTNSVGLDHSTDGNAVLGMSHHERLFRNVHSVLSPVENTAQWRAVKVKTSSAQAKPQCKENVENLALDRRFHMFRQQEIRVDASLSNWIVGNAQHSALNAPLLTTI